MKRDSRIVRIYGNVYCIGSYVMAANDMFIAKPEPEFSFQPDECIEVKVFVERKLE